MSPHDRLPPARHRARPVPQPQQMPPSAPPSGPFVSQSEPTYEVGYGKPPVATRFQKGQSGNPKGRKKGSKNLNTLVTDLLDERIAVNTPTGRRHVPRVEMLLRKLIEIGARGNPRAIDQVLRQYATAQAAMTPVASKTSALAEDMTAADVASMALLRDLFLAEASGAHASGGAS